MFAAGEFLADALVRNQEPVDRNLRSSTGGGLSSTNEFLRIEVTKTILARTSDEFNIGSSHSTGRVAILASRYTPVVRLSSLRVSLIQLSTFQGSFPSFMGVYDSSHSILTLAYSTCQCHSQIQVLVKRLGLAWYTSSRCPVHAAS